MASDQEENVVKAVKRVIASLEALPAGPEKAHLAAAIEDLRNKLGAVGYHGV